MLRREVTTQLELMFLLPRAATEGPLLDPYVSSLEQDLQQAYAQARQTLNTTQKRMKKDYDLKACRFHYEVVRDITAQPECVMPSDHGKAIDFPPH
ncbi:hypothetical protein PoB_002893400 [Plakobranchus ocellatus]|uniref:Uncharacterized protein n=1 Tax=Plakobranchus ocellatus TaxID=259542 RepID=A0AAV4A888_9GAST|nr:hypothetical protein PoB_002893400 [Plakobranchus ocellatus]